MVAASDPLSSSTEALPLEVLEAFHAGPSPSFCEGNAAREGLEAFCEVASASRGGLPYVEALLGCDACSCGL